MENRFDSKIARSLSADEAARREYAALVHNPPRLDTIPPVTAHSFDALAGRAYVEALRDFNELANLRRLDECVASAAGGERSETGRASASVPDSRRVSGAGRGR